VLWTQPVHTVGCGPYRTDRKMEESLEAQSCGQAAPNTKELSLRQQVLAATAGGIATALFGSPPLPCPATPIRFS
jgi:hypothetical protein